MTLSGLCSNKAVLLKKLKYQGEWALGFVSSLYNNSQYEVPGFEVYRLSWDKLVRRDNSVNYLTVLSTEARLLK